MEDLLSLIRSFNRKERFILMTQASSGARPLTVSDQFRDRLNRELPPDLQVPDLSDRDYVLAMDFHLNWLAAALQMAYRGVGIGQKLANPSFTPGVGDKEPVRRDSFERNQEDVDLLLGWSDGARTKLVLVEAKGHTSWQTSQLRSKSARLAAIFGEQGETYPADELGVAFVLAGFKEPVNTKFRDVWNEFARRETGTHVKEGRFIKLDAPNEVLLVGEYDEDGPKLGGGTWKVRKKSVGNKSQ